MLTLLMSALILVAPVLLACVVLVYAWRRGFWGRLCLLVCFTGFAVQAHSLMYPAQDLTHKYAQILSR